MVSGNFTVYLPFLAVSPSFGICRVSKGAKEYLWGSVWFLKWFHFKRVLHFRRNYDDNTFSNRFYPFVLTDIFIQLLLSLQLRLRVCGLVYSDREISQRKSVNTYNSQFILVVNTLTGISIGRFARRFPKECRLNRDTKSNHLSVNCIGIPNQCTLTT